MVRSELLYLLSVAVLLNVQILALESSVTILGFGRTVKNISALSSASAVPMCNFTDDTRKILHKTEELIVAIMSNMQPIVRQIRVSQSVKEKIEKISTASHEISSVFDDYTYYVKGCSDYNPFILKRFVDVLIDQRRLITDVYDIFFVLESYNFFEEILQSSQKAEAESCDEEQSLYQYLVQFFNRVLVAEMRAFAVATFCYALQGDTQWEQNFWYTRAEQRLQASTSAVQKAMSVASRDFRRCDPPEHIRNQTYIEMEHFMQNIVVNENANAQRDFHAIMEKERCMIHGVNLTSFCSEDKNCLGYTCHGNISNCTTVSEIPEVCLSPTDSARRYEWVKTHFEAKTYFQDKIYGDSTKCLGYHKRATKQNAIVLPEYKRWWSLHTPTAHYCMCTCTESDPKISLVAISFRKQVSNVKKNRVVTGIKFERQNNMVHLKIKTGKLLPFGNIDKKANNWKQLESVKLIVKNGSGEFYRLNSHRRNSNMKLKKGVDYGLLSSTNRAVYLDDVVADIGEIVTGVRFRYAQNDGEIGPIRLEVRVTSFDFVTGKLDLHNQSKWIHIDSGSTKSRTMVNLSKTNNPVLKKKNVLNQSSNQYVEFTTSNFTEDAGQSTVPFIDAQEVAPSTGFPLSGVGLYHRGDRGFGGFIGLRIISVNYSPFFEHILHQFHNINTDTLKN